MTSNTRQRPKGPSFNKIEEMGRKGKRYREGGTKKIGLNILTKRVTGVFVQDILDGVAQFLLMGKTGELRARDHTRYSSQGGK